MWTVSWMLLWSLLLLEVDAAVEEPDWGFQSFLEENFTLTCNHSSLQMEPSDWVRWTLPNGKALQQASSDNVQAKASDKVTGDDSDKVKDGDKYVLSSRDGVQNVDLTIMRIQETDAGVYLCHVYPPQGSKEDERGSLLRGLNLGGHKHHDYFDAFRHNLLVGGVAAAVFFAPVVFACFVYKFRFKTEKQHQAKRQTQQANSSGLDSKRGQEGKGTELSSVAFCDEGEINPAYSTNYDEFKGTKL